MKLPKWDGQAKPPLHHVVGHLLLGPPTAAVVAFVDAVRSATREYRDTYRSSYRAIRSWHADRWRAR